MKRWSVACLLMVCGMLGCSVEQRVTAVAKEPQVAVAARGENSQGILARTYEIAYGPAFAPVSTAYDGLPLTEVQQVLVSAAGEEAAYALIALTNAVDDVIRNFDLLLNSVDVAQGTMEVRPLYSRYMARFCSGAWDFHRSVPKKEGILYWTAVALRYAPCSDTKRACITKFIEKAEEMLADPNNAVEREEIYRSVYGAVYYSVDLANRIYIVPVLRTDEIEAFMVRHLDEQQQRARQVLVGGLGHLRSLLPERAVVIEASMREKGAWNDGPAYAREREEVATNKGPNCPEGLYYEIVNNPLGHMDLCLGAVGGTIAKLVVGRLEYLAIVDQNEEALSVLAEKTLEPGFQAEDIAKTLLQMLSRDSEQSYMCRFEALARLFETECAKAKPGEPSRVGRLLQPMVTVAQGRPLLTGRAAYPRAARERARAMLVKVAFESPSFMVRAQALRVLRCIPFGDEEMEAWSKAQLGQVANLLAELKGEAKPAKALEEQIRLNKPLDVQSLTTILEDIVRQ